MAVLDRIQHGVNGLIHTCGDVSELASHIALIMQDPELASKMGYAARTTAEDWPVSRAIQSVKKLLDSSQ